MIQLLTQTWKMILGEVTLHYLKTMRLREEWHLGVWLQEANFQLGIREEEWPPMITTQWFHNLHIIT